MKIYLMTDMEGTAGVVNFNDWADPKGRYYEEGKKLLTMEVNAAIDGFMAAGATEILVADCHGNGGIDNQLLDNRAYYMRPRPVPGPFPIMLDASFDALAWVGQHAKPGTEYAHMPHAQGWNVLDYKINGISIGEFGELAMCGAFLGVRSIFGSGDEAFAKEAAALIGGIETVSVKRGIMPGSGDEYNTDGYSMRNNGAIHIHPEKAREKIRQGAEKAVRRFLEDREQFSLLKLTLPYRLELKYRSSGTRPAYTFTCEHPESVIDLINRGNASINNRPY